MEQQIRVRSAPADRFRILLRPQEGIDLNREVVLRYGTASPKRFLFDGELETLLEDVRQRADRKRGFWMILDLP